MEVVGVDTTFACSHCECAKCTKGAIHPNGTNTCSEGCLTCSSESRDGPRHSVCPTGSVQEVG